MIVRIDKIVCIKEFEKLSKYKDVKIEIQKKWKLKTTKRPCNNSHLWNGPEKNLIHIGKIPVEPPICKINLKYCPD